MNIIQKIKSIFGFNKIKKLEEAKEFKNNEVNTEIKQNELADLKQSVNEVTKSEKVKEILKTAGCNKEVFLRVENFEDVDVDNLRKVFNLLCQINLNKQELNIVLGQNIELLEIDYNIVDKNIKDLEEYINDKEILKNIIYTNPFVLTEDMEDRISNIREVFDNIGLTLKEQLNILDENSNILSLDKDTLKNSIDVIIEYCENKEQVKDIVISEPIIIGITDKLILKQYI